MRRDALVPIALLIALPLLAGETKSAQSGAPATETASAQPADPATTTDSPMVAAAKRSKRLRGAKTSVVITNDTLAKAGKGAHLTTTVNQPEVPEIVPPKDPAVEAARARAAAELKRRQEQLDAAKKKEAEERLQRAKATAEDAEQGYYDQEDHDPSTAEKQATEAAKTAPRPPVE